MTLLPGPTVSDPGPYIVKTGGTTATCRVVEVVSEPDVPVIVTVLVANAAVRLAVTAERLVLEATGGTCRSPVGALATAEGGRLRLLAAAAAPDGRQRHLLELETEATEEAGCRLAREAGRELLGKVVSLVG